MSGSVAGQPGVPGVERSEAPDARGREVAAPFIMPDEHTAYLYLVRHGATEANLHQPPWLQGCRIDLPLCEVGRQQAEAVARLLAGAGVSRVVSSPLRRATQTAEMIAASHGLAIETVPALAECDVGRWEGLDWETIARQEPEAYRQFHADPAEYDYGGGENLADVHRRAAPALDALLAQSAGQVVMAVSHQVVNRTYLASLLGLPLRQARSIRQDNGGVNLLRRRAGKVELITLNAVFHLLPRDRAGQAAPGGP
ncbi:MAG: histidine phosphatase family protein [Planctomycetes bacterium]|nr:histidine phosphatase family protein [Planctomycetota bacterium]